MWRIWWAPNNARKWKMGFNSALKGLKVNPMVTFNLSPRTKHRPHYLSHNNPPACCQYSIWTAWTLRLGPTGCPESRYLTTNQSCVSTQKIQDINKSHKCANNFGKLLKTQLFSPTQYNRCHVLKYFTLFLKTYIALPCSVSTNMIIRVCLSLRHISSTFYMLNDQQYSRLVILQV